MTGAFVRPTPDEWSSAWPHVRQHGNELVGPCPVCGGIEKPDSDRFHVQVNPPFLFGCRKCKSAGVDLLRAVKLAGKRSDRPSRPPGPRRPPKPTVEPYVPACVPFTLRDLARAPVWIAVRDKRPVTWRSSGELFGWRYSRPEGVEVARFGGTVVVKQKQRDVRLNVLPWTTARGVNQTLLKYGQIAADRQLCLSGDAKTSYSYDVAVIDFDIHAESPPPEVVNWRKVVRDRLADANCPLTTSAGGLGFHALVRVDPSEWDGKVNVEVHGEAGLAVEIIPPGAKAAVALELGEMALKSGWDMSIPRLSRSELADVMAGEMNQ